MPGKSLRALLGEIPTFSSQRKWGTFSRSSEQKAYPGVHVSQAQRVIVPLTAASYGLHPSSARVEKKKGCECASFFSLCV
jgi:hypothetical protein